MKTKPTEIVLKTGKKSRDRRRKGGQLLIHCGVGLQVAVLDMRKDWDLERGSCLWQKTMEVKFRFLGLQIWRRKIKVLILTPTHPRKLGGA